MDGTGLSPAFSSIPLARGIHVHQALAELLVASKDSISPRETVREVLATAVSVYRQSATDFEGDQAAFLVNEQAHLIEALVWAFYRLTLPWLLDTFEIVSVEQEYDYVMGCSCGLSDGVGTERDHDLRGCSGVLLMTRPDFITRRKEDGSYGVWDFKTSGYALDQREYQHGVQFAINTVGAEAALGVEIGHYYLCGLISGKREADRGDETGLKKQRSSLCYGYYKAGDPPFGLAQLQVGGTTKKGFVRFPVWELPHVNAVPTGVSPAEWWVMDMMTGEELDGVAQVLGPQQKPAFLMESVISQMIDNEKDWREKTEMHEMGRTPDSLDYHFRQSWDCLPFRDSPCSYVPVCYKHAGHEDPASMIGQRGEKLYKVRVPHHKQEGEK
jgi:hypothetical protein